MRPPHAQFTSSDIVRQSVEAQRNVLMEILSQLDNDSGPHRENRLSVASKATTSKSTSGKQNIRLSVSQKEKIVSTSVSKSGHLHAGR